MNLKYWICTSLVLINAGMLIGALKADPVNDFNIMLHSVAIAICYIAAKKNRSK